MQKQKLAKKETQLDTLGKSPSKYENLLLKSAFSHDGDMKIPNKKVSETPKPSTQRAWVQN